MMVSYELPEASGGLGRLLSNFTQVTA